MDVYDLSHLEEDIKEMKNDVKELKEKILDPELGLYVRLRVLEKSRVFISKLFWIMTTAGIGVGVGSFIKFLF